MHPAPAWVTEARQKILKRKRARAAHEEGSDLESDDEESEDDEDVVDDLFRGTGLKKGRAGKGLLKAGEIDIDRVRDANQAEATSVSSRLSRRGAVNADCKFRELSSKLGSILPLKSSSRLLAIDDCVSSKSVALLRFISSISPDEPASDRRNRKSTPSNDSRPRTPHHDRRLPPLRLLDPPHRRPTILHVIRPSIRSSHPFASRIIDGWTGRLGSTEYGWNGRYGAILIQS